MAEGPSGPHKPGQMTRLARTETIASEGAMSMQALLKVSVLAVGLLACRVGAQGTAFAYQGMLQDAGAPANGSYDIRFTLYGDESYGSPLASVVVMEDLLISNGLFSTTLDFGAGVFDGASRWVEVAVRPGDSAGEFIALTPRQAVRPAPYAIFAANANGAGISGTIPAASLPTNSVDATILSTNIAVWMQGDGAIAYLNGNVGIGTLAPAHALDVAGTVRAFAFIGDGSGLTNLNPEAVSNALATAPVAQKTETINPMQAALMKWQVGTMASTAVGQTPCTMVFDGACIWVANHNDATLSRIRATDGQVIGTIAVGNGPGPMVFDGRCIWVVNQFDSTVTRLVAATGEYADGTLEASTVYADVAPNAIAFDGRNVWISNLGQDCSGLLKFDAATGRFANGTYYYSSFWLGGAVPVSMACDGKRIWIGASYIFDGTNYVDGVLKMNCDGTIAATYATGTDPAHLLFDGTCLWVANAGDGTVSRLNVTDGQVLGTFPVGNTPSAMTFDGVHIWVVNRADSTVTKLHASDGSYENGTLENSTYTAGTTIGGIAFDGVNIWVSDCTENTVGKL